MCLQGKWRKKSKRVKNMILVYFSRKYSSSPCWLYHSSMQISLFRRKTKKMGLLKFKGCWLSSCKHLNWFVFQWGTWFIYGFHFHILLCESINNFICDYTFQAFPFHWKCLDALTSAKREKSRYVLRCLFSFWSTRTAFPVFVYKDSKRLSKWERILRKTV